MKYFDWDPVKNEKLQAERGVSFEDVESALEDGRLLDTVTHPNGAKYPAQRIFVIEIEEYAYMVPFVLSEGRCFLKTIIPSRKMTKKYLIEGSVS